MRDAMLSIAIFVAIGGLVLFLWRDYRRKYPKSALATLQAKTPFGRERLNGIVRTAQTFYLETLRREISNVILSRDLEAFEKAFYFVHSWEDEIRASEKDWQIAEYGLILQKYLNNDDFDIIGTRHFVMYDESALDIDKLIETYQDISKLLIIERFYDAYMAKFKIYDDSELKSFENTIQRAKDRRLRNSLENAITRYYIWSRDRNVGITDNYKDKEYDIFRLLNNPNGFTPETQYGIVWKSRDEYGLYSFFVDDNGKVYESYDRSDSLFSKRESLRR